ncbi:MAG: pyridoxamine 5'-phosphate oxidase [Leptolyngbyaceae cyanobacterium SL_1_1]|nr:pyridoxamine 5'-phosphate oxidase [Leptolyngbyaceae cyanobacterium RM1_1_2]NJO09674.1 pyridoxamine 5'-phosphate oxidase [Leptolyngbyaceae cyanobacterium SL_1_1]
MDIADLRKEYTRSGLEREILNEDPLQQFELWFQQAREAELLEPNAMVLATATAAATPFQRTVLLKYFDANGFVFFTNYGSRKAQQIGENSQVSLLFLWLPLERQVHITGTAAKVSTEESLNYFLSRPRGSQLGAWTSQQSAVIASRQLLETQFEAVKQKFADDEIPLPDFWGGYRVTPASFEFWQGRPGRLHDRFFYASAESSAGSGWEIQRLSP